MALVDRLVPRLGGYLRQRPQPWTVVHGDFRADNLLFGGGRVVVVDWQTVGLGPGASDLSYLLGASLTPDARREHEGDLVDRYVDGLVAQGVAIDRDGVWQQYRRYSFGGLIMAIVASALVRRTERGDEMFVTMAERHAHQALDLDAETLISPDPRRNRAPADGTRRVLRPPDPRTAAERGDPPPALAREPVLRDAPAGPAR